MTDISPAPYIASIGSQTERAMFTSVDMFTKPKRYGRGIREYLLKRDHIKVGPYKLKTNRGDPMRMSVYGYDSVETQLVRDHLKSGQLALDIGANIGYYTTLFAMQGAVIHSYEPDPTNYSILYHNMTSNRINAALHNVAVGDHSGGSTLYLAHTPGQHSIHPTRYTNKSIIIKMETIPFDHIDFAKIDTEGAEVLVLQGFKSMPDKIIIEYNTENLISHNTTPEQFFSLLKGHTIKTITKSGLKELDYDTLYNSRMAVNLWCT